jgi:WD40 repeat protein
MAVSSRMSFVLFLILALVGRPQPVQGAPPAGATPAAANPVAHHDLVGDPLPRGAIARLGSIRLRHAGPVDAAVFSPDGRWLASHAQWESFIAVWETASGKLRCRVPMPVAAVAKMAFAADGNSLAVVVQTGSFTGEILVECWALAAVERTLRFRDEERNPEDGVLAFAPDGTHLYYGRSSLRRFDVARGKRVYRLPMGRGGSRTEVEAVIALALTPDGTTLVTAEGDGTVRLRDAPTGKERCRVAGVPASQLAFSADGKLLALGTVDAVELWHLPAPAGQIPEVTFRKRRLPRPDAGAILSLAFSADARRLVSLGAEGSVCLWDVTAGKLSVRRELPLNEFGAVTFDAAQRALAFNRTASSHGLRLWDVGQGRERFAERHLGGHIACMTFSPDGQTLATAHADKGLRFWQARTGKLLAQVRLPECPSQIDFTADGTNLVAGANGQWWKVSLGRQALDRDRAAAVPLAGPLKGWPWAPGKTHRGRALPWKTDGVEECALTHDGFLLDLERRRVGVIQLRSGKKLCEVVGSKFYGAALAPNRQTLAVFQGENTVALTEVATGLAIAQWEVPRAEMLPGQPWLLPRHTFVSGGRLLAVGTPRGGLSFWDLATNEIQKLAGPGRPIALLACAPDGRSLACAYRDATVLIWDMAAVTSKPLPNDPSLLPKYWQDLGAADGAAAWKAHWGLAGTVGTVAFLSKHLHPARAVDLSPLGQRIKELDSPRFTVREQAMKDLEHMGQAAEAALREALKSPASLETRRRLERVLKKLEQGRQRHLQELRALAVLEQIASADARAMLDALAAGEPQAPLTSAAQAARQRLGK